MKTTLSRTKCYEFRFPDLDTRVSVEETGGTVTIRATRDSFSDQRKAAFIRELTAEGFIPEDCQWFCAKEPEHFPGVQWLVDDSGVEPPADATPRPRGVTVRLIACGLLLLALMLTARFLH